VNLILSESKKLRIGSMTVFYIAQGLPIGLFLTGMAAWLSANGQPAGAIAALIATTYMPWSFKFIGAALMDRYTYLAMGRRRIWLIGSQAVMLGGLTIAALVAPGPHEVALIAWLGFAIFCGSAMQDVAVDGMAVDLLPDEEQGPVSAFMFGGQAVGIALGAGVGGYLLDHYGSAVTFYAFMPFNVIFLLMAIVLREQRGEKLLPWTKGEASPIAKERTSSNWPQILKLTFASLLKRDSVVMLIAQAFGRAAGGAFTAFWPIFATTEAKWSTSNYSSMVGTVGFFMSIGCMGIGSFMVARLGPRLSTVITYAAYGLLSLVFLVAPQIAMVGSIFVILSIVWNATDTLTSVCSNPLRMRLSDKRVAATQFTIYNALANLTVPMGASAYAIAAGYGNKVAMPIILAMVVISCVGYGMMHIGGRREHIEELEPRVD
jgi:PAT family beta-lactamase induction signal transducer AmpG